VRGENVMDKKRYTFGIRKKLVLLITVLGIITYSMSGFFIYVLYPLFFENVINETVFTIITLALGATWMGILAYCAAIFVVKPLENLEEAALRAADGDLSSNVRVSKSDDEIRAVGLAFNKMLEHTRNIVKHIDRNFQATNEKVELISEEASKASEQAENITTTITEIAQGAENSAVAVQVTAESVEDVMTIAQEVQMKARNSEETSKNMLTVVQESQGVISSLINGIEEVAVRNKESLTSVHHLADNAKKVEQIIGLVGDIAAQTNLLALNASIEAARAGEHGKGFAVVANEVRKLADESANAVKGISELITNIQTEVGQVVTQISAQVETVNAEVKKGDATRASMENMTNTIDQVANAVKDISLLVDKQMAGIQNTSIQSQEVSAIAEETSAGAEEVAAATQQQTVVIGNVDHLIHELKEQADHLKQTITQFKID
jgi:methyl-accepting chemotaxis protein